MEARDNTTMNEVLRQGFGRKSRPQADERQTKEAGTTDPKEMTVQDIVLEVAVLNSRMADLTDELSKRVPAGESEEEGSEDV
jgi:hypothetical protein